MEYALSSRAGASAVGGLDTELVRASGQIAELADAGRVPFSLARELLADIKSAVSTSNIATKLSEIRRAARFIEAAGGTPTVEVSWRGGSRVMSFSHRAHARNAATTDADRLRRFRQRQMQMEAGRSV